MRSTGLPVWARVGLGFSALAVASGGCAAEKPLGGDKVAKGVYAVLLASNSIEVLPSECRDSTVSSLGTTGCEAVQLSTLNKAQAARNSISKLVGDSRTVATAVNAVPLRKISDDCADAIINHAPAEEINESCADFAPGLLFMAAEGLTGIENALQHEARDNRQRQYNKNASVILGSLVVGGAICYVGWGFVQASNEG